MSGPSGDLDADLERALAPYGHFIVLRGQPGGTQAFGVAELAPLVGLVSLWCAREVAAGALRQWGAEVAAWFTRGRTASEPDDEAVHAEALRLHAELSEIVDAIAAGEPVDAELLARAQKVRDELPQALVRRPPLGDGDFDQLVAILKAFGLPSRAASKAADRVIDELEASG